jgi:methionine biosynthesis protein MetW
MVRIGRRQIISFPNFGHYRNRIDFLRRGRMPVPLLFGYSWYSTGHIHQLSVNDFYGLVEATGGTRIQEIGRLPSRTPLGRWLRAEFPNLFELIPIFLLG